jgi:hypothetical protein
VRLKSGEYDGADIMAAWIACDDLADMLDRAAHEPEDAHAANFTEWLCNEMPAGTVIGDPAWWARKIWAAAIVFAPEEPTAPPPEAAPKPSYDLQATLYALLCNRGYAQHEAHSLAYDDVLPLVTAPPPPDVQRDAELDRLTAENARLTADYIAHERVAASLTAERDRLREALAPFVALLQPHNDQGPDRQPIFGINDATITLGMLRTARAALGDRT